MNTQDTVRNETIVNENVDEINKGDTGEKVVNGEKDDSNEKGDIGEKDDEKMYNMSGELIKVLTRFFNEIDLVFDYVGVEILYKLKTFLNSLKNQDNLHTFVKDTVSILRKYDDYIFKIVNVKIKLKTIDFDFLNDITLFNGILNFGVFKDENKNTKVSLVKYLHNIYMCVSVLDFGVGHSDNLYNFVKEIRERDEKNKNVNVENKRRGKVVNVADINNMADINKMGNIGDISRVKDMMGGNFGNLMESLMSNGDIMNLATDLSRDIQSKNIDPMKLLTSLMSGKPDKGVQELVSNISSKIENKINSGEIDKTMLEEQAKNILGSVEGTGVDFLFN